MKITQELTGLPLMRYGFVHVTGLPARRGVEEESKSIIKVDSFRHGYYDSNNGVMVVVTLDGEIWIRHASDNKATNTPEFEALIQRLCPKGSGAFVPCSNGEAIPSHMILTRVSDPYWIGHRGEYQFRVPSDRITCVRELADPVIAH